MLTRTRGLLARGAIGLSSFVRRLLPSPRAVNLLQQKFAIPSYFHPGHDGDDDWTAAKTALLGIAVINPVSGPGYTSEYVDGTKQAEFQDRINQMHDAGADVIGYVTTNYRDSRGSNTVQGERVFTVDVTTNLVTTNDTGWTTGFGPIQVRPDKLPSTLPGGLAVSTDYYWMSASPTTGSFAASKANAANGVAIDITSAGGPEEHVMGLSRTLANISNVFFEIDQFYERWSGIDGMFFDEMNDIGDADDVEYYGRIFHHVKAKGGRALVVQNPGKSVPALMLNYADVFVTFERPSSEYAGYDPKLERHYPSAMFWHAIYSCAADDMPAVISAGREKYAGYIYVTDRTPEENAWLHIASYFLDEKSEVGKRNRALFELAG